MVFLISDFLDTGYESPLRRLGQKHDVVAVTLNDPRESALPRIGVIGLEDAETGRLVYVDTDAAAVREAYAAAARLRRAERIRSFGRMNLDAVDLSTDRPYVPALMTFFSARARRA